MRYTNEMNLPDALVSAIVNDTYSQGNADISVTTLVGPPKIRLLKKRHDDEIVEDVTDNIFRLMGTNTHAIVDRINHPDSFQEERLSMTVRGWVISGQEDLYENNTITDFKVTSVWAILHGVKPEWEAQLNIYAHLFRLAGFKVDNIQIIAFLRDWSKHRKGNDYPRKQVSVVPVPMWGHSKTQRYIEDRVLLHQAADGLKDDDIPICTPDERWAKDDAWKVYKSKNKRATRVLESKEEAENLKTEMEEKTGNKYRIEFFKGEDVRCLNYCSCSNYCNHFKTLVPF